MADNLSDIGEAIRKASEAYAEAIAAVSKALQNIAAQAGGGDRDRLIENWLRVARMSKDGMITAIEQAYEFWEREVRRTATGNPSATRSNPMDALAENWRKATEAFASGNWSQEARKQAQNVQKILSDGVRAWQRMWEPEKK
jgi:gas vesicle protein